MISKLLNEIEINYTEIIKDFEYYLSDFFRPKIKERGRQLAKVGDINYVNINFEEGEIFATIQGSTSTPYEISIFFEDLYQNSFRILDMDCTCPYDENCKHQAAVLYNFIKELKLIIKKKKLKKNVKNVIKIKLQNSGEYFSLPSALTGLDVIKSYTTKSNQRELPWQVETGMQFESGNLAQIFTVQKEYSYSSNFLKLSMWIKYENNTFYYKCGNCKVEQKGFCMHQYMLLSDMIKVISDDEFQNWDFDLSRIYKVLSQDLSLSVSIIKKYFQVHVDNCGKIKYKTNQRIFTKNSWNTIYENIVKTNKISESFELSIIEGAKRDAGLLESFIWDLGLNDNLSLINLFLGPSLKTKPGLNISKSYIANSKMYFDDKSEYDFINEINKISESAEGLKRLKHLINEYQNWFLNKPQYLNSNYKAYNIKLTKSDLQVVNFVNEQLVVNFEIRQEEEIYILEKKMSLSGKEINSKDLTNTTRFISSTKNKIFLNPSTNFIEYNVLFEDGNQIFLPKISPIELKKLITELENIGTVTFKEDLLPKQEYIENPEFIIKLREVTDAIIFEPYIRNVFEELDIYNVIPIVKSKKLLTPRKADIEFLHDYLVSAHPNFKKSGLNNFFFLSIKDLLKNNWFLNFCEGCEAAGIDILGIKELQGFKYSTKRADFSTIIKSGIDWFDVDMDLRFGTEKIAPKTWITALKNGENFVSLKDGTLGLLPEEWLRRAKRILAVAEVNKDKLRISHYKYNVIDTLFDGLDSPDVLEFIQERKDKLEKCKLNKSYTIPKKIKATLRDYQYHGYNWLRFLNDSGFGGILADDMGLGKTIQVITMLATLKKKSCSLVIVPKSLLFNWCNELDKFCPDLSYYVHHGTKRKKNLDEILKNQIVLSTYDTAASDIELLRTHTFDYIILDESQAIKNIQSKRYKAMRLLQSTNKLAMTGTPIENNTFDLYAQLSFASPGLLDSASQFKKNFSEPIDAKGDVDAASLLRKLVHPFVLRRTKEQVAKDLPEKSVSTLYCEMEPTQRKLYENLKNQIKEDIHLKIEEDGINKSRFKILDGLLRLRQMCNSPLLLNPNFKGKNASSVKIELLVNNLTETLQNHNALVFSQFTSLLAIIKKELDKRKIKYAYLDGKTKNREAEVKKFMENDDIKLFLISIKAGNTGLNLTKADYVYIVDPWWNPAVEAQAIDRTHRIGQKKNIFAYKLICKDTIEEKILQLQEKKKKIADDIIQTDENVVKKLKKEELMALFE